MIKRFYVFMQINHLFLSVIEGEQRAELTIVTWEILNICGTATALHLRLFKVNFGHWARSQVKEHSLTAMPAVHVWILALKLKHVKISVKIPPPCLESPSSFRPPPIVLRSKGRSHSFNRYSISRHSRHSFFMFLAKKNIRNKAIRIIGNR